MELLMVVHMYTARYTLTVPVTVGIGDGFVWKQDAHGSTLRPKVPQTTGEESTNKFVKPPS
eukprot:453347-Amphidinium_carterae.1